MINLELLEDVERKIEELEKTIEVFREFRQKLIEKFDGILISGSLSEDSFVITSEIQNGAFETAVKAEVEKGNKGKK
jgi:hypothetical protein